MGCPKRKPGSARFDGIGPDRPSQVRKDSPLERGGFEPSVPRKGDGFETAFRAVGKAAEWSTL